MIGFRTSHAIKFIDTTSETCGYTPAQAVGCPRSTKLFGLRIFSKNLKRSSSAGQTGRPPGIIGLLEHLRHSFASLLIRERRLSIIEIAAQMGHIPTMTLDTYGHVIAEFKSMKSINVVQEISKAGFGLLTITTRRDPNGTYILSPHGSIRI